MPRNAPFDVSAQTQSVLDALAGPTATIDADGVVTFVNEAWRRFCEEGAGIPERCDDLYDPLRRLSEEEKGACRRGVQGVLSGALPGFRFDYQRERPSGRRAYMMSVTPLTGAAGGALVTHLDITESRAAAVKFERLLEAPIDALLVVDERGVIAMVNAQMVLMFGYARDELIGRRMDFLVPERLRGRHARHHAHYYADPHARPMGTGLELLALRKDGSEFPVEISLTPLETDGRTLISAAIRDVSKHRRAEAQVVRLGRLLESSLNEIYLFDARTLRFTLVNEGGRSNLGYSMLELRALTPADLAPEFTKERFESLLRPLRTEVQATLLFTTVHRRKDGTHYPVEVHLQLFKDEKPPLFAAVIVDVTERVAAQRALLESESRVALHVEHTPLAVVEWDVQSLLLTAWNPAAERIFGYRADEVVGVRRADFIVSQEVKEQLDGVWRGQFGAGSLRSTNRNITKDGRTIICEWYNTLLRDERGVRVAALALDVTARQRALESLLTAQEEERGRISRDLHDQVGQSLTAMLLGINALEERLGEVKVEQLKALTGKTLEDVRRISRALRPALLDELGLDAALKRFARDLTAQSGVTVDVLARLPERSPRNVEVVVYRVVQESLTNIVRHAEADNASVVITADGERVHLIVEDDGKGFDLSSLSATDHVGLAGMRERLELLGGTLRIESAPGRGTTVSAKVPLLNV